MGLHPTNRGRSALSLGCSVEILGSGLVGRVEEARRRGPTAGATTPAWAGSADALRPDHRRASRTRPEPTDYHRPRRISTEPAHSLDRLASNSCLKSFSPNFDSDVPFIVSPSTLAL